MKFPKILLLLGLVLFVSCEKDENEEAIQALVGHWHIWDYEPSADSPEEASLLAKEAILELVRVGCDPIEFTFKADRKVSYRTGMRFLNPSMVEGKVSVNCAPTYDDQEGTFDYDFETLTLNLESETIKLNAAIEGRYLTTIVDDMIINGVTVSGKLYFIVETGE